ncbi:response regulator transcription factor [Paenibacillus silvae]|uniref:DNA-binding response regulator n=1 Tax=Paenibacillus silvae TaxID=1325358 RepID=A0A2W6NIB9_9BACL|nr:response regulator [Paenibacillus silvae]PZT55684.1 hypothetical protein DN757_10570 [Paenibacillus silvae]
MIIMLIEDEMLAMDELRHLMKPYESDHTVVGFDNGEDAIAYARKFAPDIVISDIRMPGRNGLEVVHDILSFHPQSQIILLSGYNDFEYVRAALKLGAKEYLLKPVMAGELDLAMKRAREAIFKLEARNQHELQWSLSQMFRGITLPADRNGEKAFTGYWLMITVLLENWKSSFTWSNSGVDIGPLLEWLRLNIHPSATCVDMDGHSRIMLLPVQENAREESLRRMSSRVNTFLLEQVEQVAVIHTVYELKKECETMEEVYRRSLQRLENQIRLGVSTFMFVNHHVSGQMFWDSARRIEAYIRDGESGKLFTELRRMLDDLRRDGITLKQTSVLLSDFLYALKYKITEPDWEAISEDLIYDFLITCRTDDALLEWLKDRLTRLMAGVHHATPQPKQIIPAILDYLNKHYAETVHLQDFALRYHVSISYLSKLFKAETGYNFSDYLIHMRLNKAIELLDSGYKRITEISRLVGYEDPKFFSQTFKRFTGVTPQEYKRKEK